MAIVFFITLIAIVTLYVLSKNKYEDITKTIKDGEYSLRSFFPIALYILDRINYNYKTKYDQMIFNKIVEIYGVKRGKAYLVIHWANKISTILLAFLILSLFGMAIEDLERIHGFLAIVVIVSLIYGTDKDLNDKIKKRHMLIKLDFPDFLNKLTLLIDAGMNITTAWHKIVSDNNSERPLYEELRIVALEIKAGKSEKKAYENFAKRCRVPEITRFISITIQNLRKGGTELTIILRLQGNECWQMRKDVAKKLGEEASTKLLIPIGIMFIGILIIVIAPALLQLQGL